VLDCGHRDSTCAVGEIRQAHHAQKYMLRSARTSAYAALMRPKKGALSSTKPGRHYFNLLMARQCVVYRWALVLPVMGEQNLRIGAALLRNVS
jgi:hypothetical protein